MKDFNHIHDHVSLRGVGGSNAKCSDDRTCGKNLEAAFPPIFSGSHKYHITIFFLTVENRGLIFNFDNLVC